MTPPRSTERSAIPLPDVDEPLVECGPLSRQSRRQERRAQAKAARRRGAPVSLAALVPTETAVVAAVAPVADAIAPLAAPIAERAEQAAPDPAMTPLPRHMALAKPRSRTMIILDRLFRGPFRRRPIEALPPVDQLRMLRDDLASVQTTIDRLLANAAV
ncbi:MAG: hypothetical protein K2W81_06975 [Sphingomonas sp.]|uniref:hypothetical protein n=1 Tax=Sphingomonas sp. TaxID=28214 RepID=UPI0025E06C6F|nr:hypothetical protein [Sphingomonas sp.]MBY0283692.1 hypothetical protein [Sphingomonas sp.]